MTWIEVKNTNDINHLKQQFGGFHDSCLKELYMWTESYVNENLGMNVPGKLDTKVRILFQRQYRNPSAIELLFEEVTQFHITPSPENYDSIIYEANILVHNGAYYFINGYDWNPKDSIRDDNSWISAKKLKWRDVSSWMGEKQRYGVLE